MCEILESVVGNWPLLGNVKHPSDIETLLRTLLCKPPSFSVETRRILRGALQEVLSLSHAQNRSS